MYSPNLKKISQFLIIKIMNLLNIWILILLVTIRHVNLQMALYSY